jgi:pilus assembly protein FimV
VSKKRAQPFKTRLTAIAVASCLGSISGLADAAGMGRLTVLSALGQPLRAEIDVSAAKEELAGMAARLAHPDAYKAAGIEYGTVLSNVRLTLDKRPNGQV